MQVNEVKNKMNFYEVVNKRRTIRELKTTPIERTVIERVLAAGFRAPSNNHLREWEFLVLQIKEEKENALQFVKEFTLNRAGKPVPGQTEIRKEMYSYAVPRQYSMLMESGCLILPFFKPRDGFPKVEAINRLNPFAAVWCCIENILLAATAEGLGAALRIPVEDEGIKTARAVNVPQGYVLPCYIALGYPKEDSLLPKQENRNLKDAIHFGEW